MYRGVVDPNRGGEWRRLSEEIRSRDWWCCRRCGKSQNENGQKLSVDHVIPWRYLSEKSKANDPGNLVSLCRRCHSWKTSAAEHAMRSGDMHQFGRYLESLAMTLTGPDPKELCQHVMAVGVEAIREKLPLMDLDPRPADGRPA